jgi:glucose/arabinose dehydrogenase
MLRAMQRVSGILGMSVALFVAAIACGEDDGATPGGPGGAGNGATGGAGGATGGAAGAGGTGTGGTGTGGVGTGGAGTGGAGGTGTGGTGTGGTGTGGSGTGGASGTGTGGTGGATPECNASAAPQVGRLGLTTVVSGLDAALYAAQPAGSSDWYIVERGGRIRVWTGGALRPAPFLDLSAENQIPGTYDERGMFGMAFAPDYATSGLFYVVLTPTTGTNANRDLVLEYKRSSGDPFTADTGSRRAILDLAPGGSAGFPLLNQVHNGGTIAFGPDRMLYVGMGDGGGNCNSARPGVPQDVSNVYGKLLRLDPKAASPFAAAGNPFASGGDARVFHYGLRNPFRFSFDSATGDLYIGNVGQESFDEVEFAASGSSAINFGWPDFEGRDGNTCPAGVPLRAGSTHTQPIHVIDGTSTTALVISVIGGAVYRGSAIPRLQGAYVFGEYYPGRPMGALFQCKTQTSPVTSIRKQCDPNVPNDPCFAIPSGGAGISELGAIVAGNDKELYIVANGTSLLKVVP